MATVIILMRALLKRFAPEWVRTELRPSPAYVAVNLGVSFLAAAAGGYFSAWMTAAQSAGPSPLSTVLALAVVVLVMGAFSVLEARGRQPLWYQLTLVVIAPLGVVAGGLLRLRASGFV